MDPLFQDERISAYLDNELSADERSQFEDELARNGELRQIVEELRGLHDSLQILPRRRLNDDFAQHVMRRAERAMLTDSRAAANGAAGSATEASFAAASGSNSISDARKSRRPWIWAAVAIAAAIALMVFNPPPQKPVQVVQADSNAQSSVIKPSVLKQIKSNEWRQEEQISATPTVEVQKRAEGPADEKNTGDGEAPQTRSSLAKAAEHRGEASERLADSSTEKSVDGAPSAKIFRQADPGYGRSALQTGASPSNRPVENAAERKPQSFAGSIDRAAAAKGDSADAGKLAEGARRAGSDVGKGRGQLPVSRSFSYGSGQDGQKSLLTGDMFVAEYATASIDTLQGLLDKRGIALNNSPAAMLTAIGAVRNVSDGSVTAGTRTLSISGDGNQVGGKSNLAGDHSHRPAAGSVPGSKAPGRARAPVSDAPVTDAENFSSPQIAAAPDEPLEVVYVVGSRKQVMGLIDDLHAQPAEYRALAFSAVSRSTVEEREQDAKASNGQLLAKDEAGQGASEMKRDGQVRTSVVQSRPGAAAPAAPQSAPFSPIAAPSIAAASAPADGLSKSALAQDKSLPKESVTGPVAASLGHASGAVVPLGANKGASNKDSTTKEIAKNEAEAFDATQKEPKQSPANKPGAAGLGAIGPGGPAPIAAEQQKAAPAPPAAESGIASAAADADLGEPSERTGDTAWAARMTSLAPDTEHVLRQALAHHEGHPAYRVEQLRQQADHVALDDSSASNREKGSDKAKVANQLQSAEGKGASAGQLDGAAASDQVQAVFVFRLMPAKVSPTKPTSPVAAPAKAAK